MSPFGLNLRHLRAVPAIVERGSLVAAAGAVALSQPALTQGLAKIEAALGVRLFDRRADGMAATPAALLLGPRVTRAFAHLGGAMRGRGGGAARLTMAQLRALLLFAAHGSFLAAARAGGLAAPSLHRAIGELEALTATRLVERRGRAVAMTPAGRALARAFRLAIGELEAALGDLGGLAGEGGTRIAVGAMPLARARLLPAAIARLCAAEPLARVRVVEGGHAELLEQLRAGDLDLLVGALRDTSPGPDVIEAALLDDRVVIAARAGHPLAGGAPEPAALARHPWIVPPLGTPLHARWRGLFSPAQPPPAPIECGSVMVIRGVLLDSDCLTLFSPDQIALELRAGVLVTIGAPLAGAARRIGVTTRAEWRANTIQQGFLDLLHAVAREMGTPQNR